MITSLYHIPSVQSISQAGSISSPSGRGPVLSPPFNEFLQPSPQRQYPSSHARKRFPWKEADGLDGRRKGMKPDLAGEFDGRKIRGDRPGGAGKLLYPDLECAFDMERPRSRASARNLSRKF